MAKLHAAVLVGLVACGGNNATPDAAIKIVDAAPDSKVFMDAPPPMYDFSCMGNAAPTTATATVTVSGTVSEVSIVGMAPQVNPLADAKVDACKAGAANCTGSNHFGTQATSAATTGAYSIGPVDTGSVPLDAYLAMTHAGDRDTRVYPGQPLVADQGMVPVLTFKSSDFALILLALSINQSAGNGNLGLLFTDCANTPITDEANLTLSVKQGGQDVQNTTQISGSAFGSMGAGLYLIFNVPPGATDVGGMYKGMPLRTHTVTAVAATTTETIVRPGY